MIDGQVKVTGKPSKYFSLTVQCLRQVARRLDPSIWEDTTMSFASKV